MSRSTDLRVLIAPGVLRGRPGAFRELLTAQGYTLVEPPGGDVLPEAELIPWLGAVDAILAGAEAYPDHVLAHAGRARILARVGVGYDNVDVAAATARALPVTITPGTNHEAVAEHALALLLALTRLVVRDDRRIRQGQWVRSIVTPVRGTTLGLVGLGRIGQALVPRARGLAMRVIAHDPMPEVVEVARRLDVPLVSLDELLATADVVSLHAPITPETVHLINRERLALMKPTSYLINTSRGRLVDEVALLDALTSGRLAGAGLDVLEEEPPPADHPFFALDNVVLTPHTAGVDCRSLDDMAELAARCIVARLTGQPIPPGCLLNPAALRDHRD